MPYRKLVTRQLDFLYCNAETRRNLDEFNKLLAPEIDRMLDHLYEKMLLIPELKAIFRDRKSIAAARDFQKEHWLNVLFNRKFGERYFDSAERVAETYERLGVELEWYLGVYCLMHNKFVRLVCDRFHDDPVKATQMVQEINKAVYLDMNFVIDRYLSAKNSAIRSVLMRSEKFKNHVGQVNRSLREESDRLKHEIGEMKQQLQGIAGLSTTMKPEEDDGTAIAERGLRLEQAIRSLSDQLDRASSQAGRLEERIAGVDDELVRLNDGAEAWFFPAAKD